MTFQPPPPPPRGPPAVRRPAVRRRRSAAAASRPAAGRSARPSRPARRAGQPPVGSAAEPVGPRPASRPARWRLAARWRQLRPEDREPAGLGHPRRRPARVHLQLLRLLHGTRPRAGSPTTRRSSSAWNGFFGWFAMLLAVIGSAVDRARAVHAAREAAVPEPARRARPRSRSRRLCVILALFVMPGLRRRRPGLRQRRRRGPRLRLLDQPDRDPRRSGPVVHALHRRPAASCRSAPARRVPARADRPQRGRRARAASHARTPTSGPGHRQGVPALIVSDRAEPLRCRMGYRTLRPTSSPTVRIRS